MELLPNPEEDQDAHKRLKLQAQQHDRMLTDTTVLSPYAFRVLIGAFGFKGTIRVNRLNSDVSIHHVVHLIRR